MGARNYSRAQYKISRYTVIQVNKNILYNIRLELTRNWLIGNTHEPLHSLTDLEADKIEDKMYPQIEAWSELEQ